MKKLRRKKKLHEIKTFLTAGEDWSELQPRTIWIEKQEQTPEFIKWRMNHDN